MPLFPLPLVPIEHYMLADDRPDYPMTFFLQLRFAGRLDQPLFRAALSTALTLHPLLHAHVRGPEQATTSRLAWVDAGEQKPFLSWAGEESPLDFPSGERIDLRSEEDGVRLWVREGPETTRLLGQFHHSCCDGLGGVHFLETLLAAYARPSQPLPQGLPDGDRQILRTRGRLGATWIDHLRRLPRDAASIGRFFGTTPVPLPSLSPDTNGLPAAPDLLSHSFDEAESKQVRDTARLRQVTVNDLLLRDLFLALDGWNRRHTSSGDAGALRIAMPVNMRVPPEMRSAAMNAVSMVFFDRRPAQCADPDRLLAGLRAQTEDVKRWRLGVTMLLVLDLLGGLPGGLAALFNGRRCLNSAVLSNLGVPFVRVPRLPGDAVLQEVVLFPPIRPLTRAAFGVASHAGRLALALHYDGHVMTVGDGRNLLDAFVRQVRQSLRWEGLSS